MAAPAPTRRPQPQNNPMIQNIPNDSILSSINNVPEVKENEFQAWVSKIYDVSDISQDNLNTWFQAFSYQGFNRDDVLKQLFARVNDKQIVYQLIIAGALRGPQQGSRLKLSNNKSALEMGIPASGRKGTKTLTMNKIIAATADLAAWLLKKLNAPKRLNIDLPGWLQFPSAASIKMSDELKSKHKDFAKNFSKQIGGEFNEQIYDTMVMNAYINVNLRLFE